MVPNVNARGTSFKGVAAYLLHDKNNAQTSERVEWTATRNMITDDIGTASKIMAFTDINSEGIKRDFGGSSAGAKREAGAVYHFSLSESPENKPTQEEWEKYVDDNIKVLGLEGHQYYMVSHNDEPHAHVHVVVNLIHPETGKINSLHNDYKKMDKLAHEYELENGIVCEDRDKKYKAWEQEQNAFKEKERREEYAGIVTKAFQQSDNSKSFKAALEHEGLTLAQGNRRGFVLVDQQGEIFALNRLISFEDSLKRKEKNAAINDKLEGIDKAALPVADKLQEQRQNVDREAEEVKQQNALLDAAEKSAQEQIQQDVIKEVEALKIIQEKRGEIYKKAKIDWREIKALHAQERKDLRKEITGINELRLKEHYIHWNKIIAEEKQYKDVLQSDLDKKGLAGVYLRLRYGKEIRQEVENIDKNIANAQMRLDGGIVGKTNENFKALKEQQKQQREELRTRIAKDLKNAEEESKKEAENKILLEASSSPEKTAELQHNVKVEAKADFAKVRRLKIVDDMERDALILSERAAAENARNQLTISGEKMSDPRTSLEKWEDSAMTERFEDIAAKLHHPEATVEKIFEQEEAQRQELESTNTNKVTVETEEKNIEEWEAKEAEQHQGASWEQWQEYFEERREEINHDKTLTEGQRTLAHDELEEEYYENQSVYEQQQTQEHNQEQIEDQDQGLER